MAQAALHEIRRVFVCVCGSCMFNDKTWWDRDRGDCIHLCFSTNPLFECGHTHKHTHTDLCSFHNTTQSCSVSVVLICILHVKLQHVDVQKSDTQALESTHAEIMPWEDWKKTACLLHTKRLDFVKGKSELSWQETNKTEDGKWEQWVNSGCFPRKCGHKEGLLF